MNHRWQCDHCGYEAYAPNRSSLVTQVKRHLAENGGTILVYDPHDGSYRSEECLDSLLPFDVTSTSVLWITQNPADHLADWRRHADRWPARIHLVTPGTPPLTGDRLTEGDIESAPIDVTRVQNRSLQDLGIAVSGELEKLDAVDAGIVACFDSLSGLLGNFEVKDMFNFVKLLNTRMRRVDALAHYHLTPASHIESTVHVFEELFDVILDTTDETSSIRLP